MVICLFRKVVTHMTSQFAIGMFLLLCMQWQYIYAEESVSDVLDNQRKVYIQSDKLISDQNSAFFEFIGNVKATQEHTVITADSLKIFFRHTSENSKQTTLAPDSIQKIIAQGNVNIRFDNRVAVTQKAVYNSDKKLLVLTGKDSRVTSDGNTITGEKITVNRANGQITVDGGKGRVTTILNAEETDSQ